MTPEVKSIVPVVELMSDDEILSLMIEEDKEYQQQFHNLPDCWFYGLES